MNNLAGILGEIDKQKPLVKQEGTPWVRRKELAMGAFHFRGLANDEKCPDGFRIYTVHEIQKKPVENKFKLERDEKERAFAHILCTESYKGWCQVENDEGTLINKLAAPCPVCDTYADILDTYDTDELDPDVVRALDDMSSASCRRFLYPIILYASMTETHDDKGNKKKLWTPNERTPTLVILSLLSKAYEGNADLTLIKHLSAQVYGDITNLSSRQGQTFIYEKTTNNQKVYPVGGRSALGEKEMATLKTFPNIASYGMGDSASPFAKNFKVGYAKGKAMLEESWFIKDLTKRNDYDIEAVPEGMV